MSTKPNDQQLFSQLSSQYKTPLRNVLGEAQEIVQNTVSNILQQLIQMNKVLADSKKEVERLKKILDENKINYIVSPKPPNRAERRREERKK